MSPRPTKFRQFLTLVALSGLLLAGCDDIIEPDISDKQLVLLTPADSSRTTSVVQTFRWEALPSARSYRVQVASPSLAAPTRYFLDSTVTPAFFTTTLTPGTYQWRVQAVNGSYQTAFVARSFTLDTTSSLTNQTLRLEQPAANFVTNAGVIRFAWTALPMAQRYRLHITPNPLVAGAAALDSVVSNATTLSLAVPLTSQVYQWQLTALNATSSVESSTRSFEVDVTPPPAPSLVSPAAAATFLDLPVTLSWSRGAADVVQDSVFFYQPNQINLFTGFPRLSSGTTLTLATPALTLTTGSTYYWAVRSIDRAGNVGPIAVKRAFAMQ
jgi:predicted phage tail protein